MEATDDATGRLQAELSEVKRQLAEFQAEIKEHEDFRTESKELETELERELEDVRAINDKLSRENADLKAKQAALQSEANNNLTAMQGELERLRASDAANRERVRDLETAFSELEQTHRATEASAATSLAQFAELAERAAFLEEEVDAKRVMEGDMQRLRDQIREHEEELARQKTRQLASLSSASFSEGEATGSRGKLGEDEMAARKEKYAELRKSGQLFSPTEIAALDTDYKNDTPARRAQQAELRRAFQEEARLSMANMVSRAQALEERMAAVRATYANYRVKTEPNSASRTPVNHTLTPNAANTGGSPQRRTPSPSPTPAKAPSETGTTLMGDSADEDNGNDDGDELEEAGFDDMDADAPPPPPLATTTPAPTTAANGVDVDLLATDAAVTRPEVEANTALAIDKVDKAQDRAAMDGVMDVDHQASFANADGRNSDQLLSPEAAVLRPETEANTELPIGHVDAAQDRAAMEGVQNHTSVEHATTDLLSPEAAVLKPETEANTELPIGHVDAAQDPNTELPIGHVDAAQDRAAMEGVQSHTSVEPAPTDLLSPEAAVLKPDTEANTELLIERVDAAQDRAAMEGVQNHTSAPTAQPATTDLLSPDAAAAAVKKEIAPDTALPIGKVDAAQDRVAMEGVGAPAVGGHAASAAGSSLAP
ncbi:NADH:ubiquinone oxidoreductase [Geranomyces variabilis]|uniref:NADH:ubiquinone oxidoreductase n=1 Tax=Geranomyces variabilis TaxID=109894 RepID=A0AAD5XR16_9FUNG|nr:NADH:ubiquinone oxidoreductase [Geranomyces variabilis]